MASPTAAACAALIRQVRPTDAPTVIESRLEATGVPVTDPTNGLTFPRIDCAAAVRPVAGPSVSINDVAVLEGNANTRLPRSPRRRWLIVTVTGDTLVEAIERFTLNLSVATGATIADGLGIGTITNDD